MLREGSALGAVRDYPETLIGIPWEFDEDIAFETKDSDKVHAWIKANSVPQKLWLDDSVKSLFTLHSQTMIQIAASGVSFEIEPIDWCHVPKSEGIFFVPKDASSYFAREYGPDWRTPKCDASVAAVGRQAACSLYKDMHFNTFVDWGSLCLCTSYILVCQGICAVIEAKRETDNLSKPRGVIVQTLRLFAVFVFFSWSCFSVVPDMIQCWRKLCIELRLAFGVPSQFQPIPFHLYGALGLR